MTRKKSLTEKKIFGSITSMLNCSKCCALVKNSLIIRIDPENYAKALTEQNTRTMDFTGKPLRGFVFVDPDGYQMNGELAK